MSEHPTLFSSSDQTAARAAVRIESESDMAALIALAGLPNLSPPRFWSLVELGSLTETWQRVAHGGAPRNNHPRDAAGGWAGWSSLIDPDRELDRHRRFGVAVHPFGSPGYPRALLDDPDPPVVVFQDGKPRLGDRPRVAIVGTRLCSRYGRDIAYELGAALAGRGVDVVSGLAKGIDACAHAGAETADPERLVAVVAGGVDVVYPRGNFGLWQKVVASGSLLSEWPLGAEPTRWRFPARNRVVAALAAAVVVVESAPKGGSMYTVDEALRRNRPVFAVPGSIRSSVSNGTNQLINDGAHALVNIADLVDAVAPAPTRSTRAQSAEQLAGQVPESWLLEAIGWEPMALDSIVAETDRAPGEITLEAERLIAAGSLRRAGGIVERLR